MGEQSVTIYAGNFAKFQVFQESLQASSSSSSIATVVEPSITKCLLTSSTKWIIDPDESSSSKLGSGTITLTIPFFVLYSYDEKLLVKDMSQEAFMFLTTRYRKLYLVSPDVTFSETLPFSQPLSSPSQGEDDDSFSLQDYLSHITLSSTFMCPFPPAHIPNDDLPIALWKGKCTCTYPISSFVSYTQLSSPTYSFITSLDSTSIPNFVREALSHLGWRSAMIEEMTALDDNGTWGLVSRLAEKKGIECKWVCYKGQS
ncbi:Cysteine-rich RLK (RECEPTOR-like protein kinase) 8 [Cucumis melo var. makuwa]|uniref:Cysteine-rich RLK (RECEPTOR-like protein kinase) 8 n=1 Tax=Cucumis melo var. makuwa TaxID=1194695 RepID=A0A5D3DYK3_CUCMM|nr:Cysteine-rich RLK (RECEPTOR-like protein kinase) 8 [Cucumis melo var. makuwa]